MAFLSKLFEVNGGIAGRCACLNSESMVRACDVVALIDRDRSWTLRSRSRRPRAGGGRVLVESEERRDDDAIGEEAWSTNVEEAGEKR